VSVNLGPLVLTVMQCCGAAVGFLLGIALVPPGTPYRRAGLLFGVVGAVLLASLVYRRHVRAALPAALGGDRTADADGDDVAAAGAGTDGGAGDRERRR